MQMPLFPETQNTLSDRNVEAVREKLLQRSLTGISKYGCTTCTNPLDKLQWLNHLQEELMDACVYIEAAMKEIEHAK